MCCSVACDCPEYSVASSFWEVWTTDSVTFFMCFFPIPIHLHTSDPWCHVKIAKHHRRNCSLLTLNEKLCQKKENCIIPKAILLLSLCFIVQDHPHSISQLAACDRLKPQSDKTYDHSHRPSARHSRGDFTFVLSRCVVLSLR